MPRTNPEMARFSKTLGLTSQTWQDLYKLQLFMKIPSLAETIEALVQDRVQVMQWIENSKDENLTSQR